MAEEANHNRDVAASLQALMDAYEMGGGSNNYNMVSLRASFAQFIPFTHPNFHRHFSIFATEAVARDLRANRFVYPIGGHQPDPNIPIQDTAPYILPIHLFQNLRFNDQRERGEREGQERGGERRQDIVEQEEPRRDAMEMGDRAGEGEREERNERRQEEGGSRSRKGNINLDDESSSDESIHQQRQKSSTQFEFSFIKNADAEEKSLPPEATAITKLVLEYRTNDLNAAVMAFCWKSGKHHDFPDALVRDLLQYKFIDLEKINAGPSACKFDIFTRSKDSDPSSKIKPKAFKEATEWRDAVTLLVETLCIAFVAEISKIKNSISFFGYV